MGLEEDNSVVMAEEVDTRKGCLSFRLPVSLSVIHLFFTSLSSFFHNQIVFPTETIDLLIFPTPSFNSNKDSARDKKIRSLFSCNKLHLKQKILSRVSKKKRKKKKGYNFYYSFHSSLVINIIFLLHALLSLINVPELF